MHIYIFFCSHLESAEKVSVTCHDRCMLFYDLLKVTSSYASFNNNVGLRRWTPMAGKEFETIVNVYTTCSSLQFRKHQWILYCRLMIFVVEKLTPRLCIC